MSAPMGIEQPLTGGQVPLLKHRLMQWFKDHLRNNVNGEVERTDSAVLARETKASVTNVNRALWDIQKQGLITFRESKNGGDGHSMGHILSHFRLTPKGMGWKAETAVLAEVVLGPTSRDDLNPDWMAQVDAKDIADDIVKTGAAKRVDKAIDMVLRESVPPAPCTCGHPVGTRLRQAEHLRGCPWAAQQEALVARLQAEAVALAAGDKPEDVAQRIIATERATHGPFVRDGLDPAQALVAYLRWHKATTGQEWAKIVPDANEALGYHRLSTALYSLIASPRIGGRIERTKEGIRLKADVEPDWLPESAPKAHGGVPRVKPTEVYHGATAARNARMSSPVSDEVTSVVTLPSGEKAEWIAKPVAFTMPELGPELTELMAREVKRAKVATAAAALEEVGLVDDALTVLQRIPDDTPFEREVIAFVKAVEAQK